ncbi:MAG: cytochrome C oxidase subunit IV family protein [Polyangiaceae bacterium]|jgi:cytochrome c oxidase subunit 4
MAIDHGDLHPDVHDDGRVHAHVSSVQFYCGIFAALVLLTFATVKVSYYDFGSLNIIVALLIATVKASLVAAFFMHLRHDSLFNTLALLASIFFLALFILLTYDDLGRRGQLDPAYGGVISPETGLAAPGGMPATTATENEAPPAPPSGANPEKK